MKYYTNLKYQDKEDLYNTVTIKVTEDIQGSYSGQTIKKGSQIVVSDSQYETLMRMMDDKEWVWDLIVEYEVMSEYMNRDQFRLNYTVDNTNFQSPLSNC